MSELEESGKYEGKLTFTIVPNEGDGFAAGVREYGLGTHGLVVLDAEGESKATIPGHQFGKAEIEAAIAKVLN